jgi:hypothetical protein
MGDLSFENIKNGNWYVIPGHYFDKPARIYKTIYHGDCYIKAIAPSDQQDIVRVPCNENIFEEPKETDVDMDDQEDDFDDDVYLEIKELNQYVNFVTYDPNEHLDLDDDEKLELYNIFIKIEKSLQKGGRKKKRNIFTRKSKKNKNKFYNNNNYIYIWENLIKREEVVHLQNHKETTIHRMQILFQEKI